MLFTPTALILADHAQRNLLTSARLDGPTTAPAAQRRPRHPGPAVAAVPGPPDPPRCLRLTKALISVGFAFDRQSHCTPARQKGKPCPHSCRSTRRPIGSVPSAER